MLSMERSLNSRARKSIEKEEDCGHFSKMQKDIIEHMDIPYREKERFGEQSFHGSLYYVMKLVRCPMHS